MNVEAAAQTRLEEVEERLELLEQSVGEDEQEDHGNDLRIREFEILRDENAAMLVSKDQDIELLSDKYAANLMAKDKKISTLRAKYKNDEMKGSTIGIG